VKRLHYGWVMVACALGILSTHALIFYSFGIFLRPITSEFHWERGALSIALSLNMLISAPLSIVTGRLSDKYGPQALVALSGIATGAGFILMSQVSNIWHVYLIYGSLIAIGGSGCIVPITSTIPRWFTRRRGMALGLTWTGIGLGGIIGPVLSQSLISGFGWRFAYIVLGIVVIVIVTPLSQFLKSTPQKMGILPYGENQVSEVRTPIATIPEGLSYRQALKTSRFWLLGLLLASFIFIVQIMMSHLAPHAMDIGIPEVIAASTISLLATTSLIGRNLSGVVSDKIGARKTITAGLFLLLFVLTWLVFAQSVWMFYIFAIFYGIAYGSIVPMQTILTGELFGLKALGMITASIMLIGSIGGAIGAPLAGAIYDSTGTYRIAFLICISLCILAIVFSFILLRSKTKKSINTTPYS